MDLATAGLNEQPFRSHGKPIVTVDYESRRDCLETLDDVCRHPSGLMLLQGPPLSGKTTLVYEFVEKHLDGCAVAVIDGAGLNTTGLLEAMLRQFGYLVDFNSTGELLAMTRVFAMQQAASHAAPVVVVENAHALNPSAVRALSELAGLKVRQTSALKIILTSDQPLIGMLNVPAMEPMRARLRADYHLRPMTSEETSNYLHSKLRAAGSDVPEFIFPASVCNEVWQASAGWPGIVDRVALLALSRAETVPVAISIIEHPTLPAGTWDMEALAETRMEPGSPPTPPTLHITHAGETQQTLTFDKSRLLIGRSEHNDISIDSRFVSRHHLLLVRSGRSTFLMDLNSTNGTFVNSRRASNHVLIDSDVISIGQHRIKFSDPHARERGTLDGDDFADTAIMKTLEDMRALLARENTEILPSASENLPTISH